MFLFRLILLVLAAYVLFRVYRSLRMRSEKPKSPGRITEDMVRCAECQLHVPRSNALGGEPDWFCGEEHRRLYLARSRGG